jgi:sensor histidine kinase YesM
VENAVKHGMDPESEPLRISIRTRSTDLGSEIIVEDNGPGFDPDWQDALVAGQPHGGDAFAMTAWKGAAPPTAAGGSEPHIALANIQQRLKMMCSGEMTIMPREGGGTVVKVTIP